MTTLFRDMRLYGHIILLLLAATVLGIAAYWASIFLPNIRHDYSIFGLVVPSLTILIILAGLQWSTPRIEVFFLFVLGVLWLAMGAWTTDIIGNTQCDSLNGQQVPTKNGSLSARSWCYEMRVVQAFSWMIFCLYAIFLYILIALTTRAKAFGLRDAWADPIVVLPWFGQMPAVPGGMMYPVPYGYQYPGGQYPGGQYPGNQYPGMPPMPGMAMSGTGSVIQQQPGHSIVIQHHGNGQNPTITQVPGSVSSV